MSTMDLSLSQPVPKPGLQVINTAELLQHILLHLDIRTALTVGLRVCRLWHHIITTSQAIQRALFFLPEPDLPASTPPSEIRTHRRQNPLLAEAFPAWFDSSPSERTYKHLQAPSPSRAESRNNAPKDPLDRHRWQPFHASGIARNRRGFLYRAASWRRMLVTQPPVRTLGYVFSAAPLAGPQARADAAPRLCTAFAGREKIHPGDRAAWEDGEFCSCMHPSMERHPAFGRRGVAVAMAPGEEAVFCGADFRAGVMLDGLRMGMLYDMTQHIRRGGWWASRWRVVWEGGEGEDLSTRALLGEFGGPVLQLEGRRLSAAPGVREEMFVREASWEVQFRFPMGSGLALAERWKGDAEDGGLEDDESRSRALAAIARFDRELDERDEMYARAMRPVEELPEEAS
jgi:hypothetical protein